MSDRVGRILVVDDERHMRELCRRNLSAAGHEVTVAESGAKALEVFREDNFDLVLTDLMMPGMSGLELLVNVLEVDPEMACVMMTAQATIETAVEAIKRGAYNYVSKPFTSDELVTLVENALAVRWLKLESARLRQEAERNLLLVATEQSRTRTVVESMADGVMVTNREGMLVLYNPAVLRLLGIKHALPTLGAPPSRGFALSIGQRPARVLPPPGEAGDAGAHPRAAGCHGSARGGRRVRRPSGRQSQDHPHHRPAPRISAHRRRPGGAYEALYQPHRQCHQVQPRGRVGAG